MGSNPSPDTAAPIPITIITGFLGSGKTTLILNLLPQLRAANPSYRLALLKNEFGDVAVDSQLASAAAAAGGAISGVREMLNGCICCNLVGRLGDALAELTAADEKRPDRIVVETSGSAFPATLAMEVNRLAEETRGWYVLDGVVGVIDVENWRGYEDTSYTARVQARFTDLIVFNKWEGAGERRFDECLDRVGDLEVDTAWVKSDKGRVGMDVIFGIDGGLAQELIDEGTGHGHGHAHDHQSEVEVLSVALRGGGRDEEDAAAVDVDRLLGFLRRAPKEEVYRIKAVLDARTPPPGSSDDSRRPPVLPPPPPGSGSTGRYILNWAFGRWTFTPLPGDVAEHESSGEVPLRMTLILARYESTKWKRKLEAGGLVELEGGAKGELTVTKIG